MTSAAPASRLGVDVGGTFTDLVALHEGRLAVAKVPSTPADQSAGVMAAVAATGLDPSAFSVFAHGTTVATNALLERNGARTALVTTEGFRDVLEIGRQDRLSLYNLTAARPPPLVPRELRFVVRERMGPEGVLVALSGEAVDAAVAAVRAAEVQAVAVCLLFSFLHPGHERELGRALREALPGVQVSLSSEVLPAFREYERFATTAVDAYLGPRLSGYLQALGARAGLPEPLVMQSSGGVTPAAVAATRAAACVLSGPAGGVVGAARVARSAGHEDVLSFDMGGTSTDVAVIAGGRVQSTTEAGVAGLPVALPMVDVHTVSAGGGSIAWVDGGGALRVGPGSAGAEPGPAAYGRGGPDAAATVTDAHVVLGHLAGGAVLGGEVTLSHRAATEAVTRLGRRAGLQPLATAAGILAVADAGMARALRHVTVRRGLDPRDFALVCFGGAGGLHACALAVELGLGTVLVPRAAGVLSALGLALGDLRRDDVCPRHEPLVDVDAESLRESFEQLRAAAEAELPGAVLRPNADLRYRGQGHELTVEAGGGDPAALARAFHAAHERRHGYRMDEQPVELVSLRLTATVPAGADLPAAISDEPRPPASRELWIDGTWTPALVLDGGGLQRGRQIAGPAVVEYADSTCLVSPGWAGTVDEAGTLVLGPA